MQILAGFQFQNRQPSTAGHCEQIEHRTVCSRKCGHLAVDQVRTERIINLGKVAGQRWD